MEVSKGDLTKLKSDIEKMFEKEVKKQLKIYDEDNTNKIKEICAKAINNFLKITYQKNNFWINDIK